MKMSGKEKKSLGTPYERLILGSSLSVVGKEDFSLHFLGCVSPSHFLGREGVIALSASAHKRSKSVTPSLSLVGALKEKGMSRKDT